MNNVDRFFTKNSITFAESYIEYLTKVLKSIDVKEIGLFIEILMEARQRGAAIYFAGNGGSAATASHFANDIGIGTNSFDKPFRAISLADNMAVITAISNDFGYDEIFERQLKVVGLPGDVLVSISASGNSSNLIKAINYANSVGIRTVGITAFDGGMIKNIVNSGVHVPTEKGEYGPSEDAHMVLDHLVGAYLIRAIKAKEVFE
jgi:D-sedoheptulose 7-phosphate isomerase